jgi:nitrous oxidase accessory protein NosD
MIYDTTQNGIESACTYLNNNIGVHFTLNEIYIHDNSHQLVMHY